MYPQSHHIKSTTLLTTFHGRRLYSHLYIFNHSRSALVTLVNDLRCNTAESKYTIKL